MFVKDYPKNSSLLFIKAKNNEHKIYKRRIKDEIDLCPKINENKRRIKE